MKCEIDLQLKTAVRKLLGMWLNHRDSDNYFWQICALGQWQSRRKYQKGNIVLHTAFFQNHNFIWSLPRNIFYEIAIAREHIFVRNSYPSPCGWTWKRGERVNWSHDFKEFIAWNTFKIYKFKSTEKRQCNLVFSQTRS